MFSGRCGTTSAVLVGGRALRRHTTYSHAHTRTVTSLNDHLGGRCGVGVVVIKYETKNDFLYSKQLSGVFQHRLRSPRTYSEGWSISRGRSDSYHLNGSVTRTNTRTKTRKFAGVVQFVWPYRYTFLSLGTVTLPFKWHESQRPREMDHPSEYVLGDLSLC